MQPEERDLIVGLFDRLRPYESQPRDGEVERLIAERMARQPAAPYLLAQTVLVQEQALKAAQERIAELEGKNSGFLGSAPKIGPWGVKPGMAAQAVPGTQGAPATAALAPGPQGGSFMRTALATAAGVAGGALLFEGMRNLFAHNPGPFGGVAQAAPLLPPDNAREQFSSADLAQDDGAADDYDLTDDNSGFGGGGSDDL